MTVLNTIFLRRPDDWHVHFRDGAMLRQVVPWTARQFARAIVMPNLVPPVTTVAAAREYRERIVAACLPGAEFTPLMTCYLTDGADPGEIARGFEEGVFAAVKLYPAHATTHSAHGVTDIDRVMPVLERMAAIGMPLLIHGEVDRSRDRHLRSRGRVHRARARQAARPSARTAHRTGACHNRGGGRLCRRRRS